MPDSLPPPLGDAPRGASHDPSTSDEPPVDAVTPSVPAVPELAPRRLGDPTGERPVPRGCNPLVFGVVMATIQLGCTLYFMQTC